MAKKYEDQMDIFEEGGLKDEGGSVDPVSGNEVPSGSTQKEVRDDIPAQLSEGEFVFPADVVRYIGLENLMQLRQKAKMGLQQMENMGQMGNADEAIIPDDLEYNAEVDMLIDEFDPESPETMEFNQGGVVSAQQGAYIPGSAQGMMQPPQPGGFQPPMYQAPGVPTGQQLLGNVPSPVMYGTDQYVGPTGDIINITTVNGNPVQEIPEGYKKYNPATAPVAPPQISQPTVQVERDGGGRDDQETPSTSGFNQGMTNEQVQDALAQVNTDLAKAIENRPTNVVDVLSRGLMGNVIGAIQRGYLTNKAANEVRSGFGLTNKPTKEYADFRSNVNNATAASIAMTEKEARDIVSGGDDDDGPGIQGSSFASKAEAEAVANSGWGSDDHLDTIDPDDGEMAGMGGASSASGGVSQDDIDAQGAAAAAGLGGSSDDDDDNGDNNSGGSNPAGDVDSGPGSGFGYAKGGAVEQTKRALKSSRKKK